MNRNGQMNVSAVIGIVLILVSISIGGLIYSEVSEEISDQVETEDTHYVTDQRPLSSSSAWTLENTSILGIEHTGENILENAEASGSGTATLSQSIDVDYSDSVKSATLDAALIITDGDNLVDENIEVRLVDPSGNTDVIEENRGMSSAHTNWTVYEDSDVASYIDEDGTFTIEVYTEASTNYPNAVTYVDNVELDVNVKGIGEQVQEETNSGANTIFPLLVLIVIIGVFVMLIGVLRMLG